MSKARTDGPLNLTRERMMELTDAYFRSFNVLLPILGYDVFVSTLERVTSQGFAEGDLDAVLALLVFALGELASEGTFGQPVSVYEGVSSGFRGGKTLQDNIYLTDEAGYRTRYSEIVGLKIQPG